MKKKLLIILGVFIVLLVCGSIWFYMMLRPVEADGVVSFTIKPGTNKIEIVDDLKKAGLIRSKIATLIYVFASPSLNLQAGEYEISRNNSVAEILSIIGEGKIVDKRNIVRITFVEGKRFKDYAEQISKNFDVTYDEIIKKCENKEFLNKLIENYWFIDESILADKLYFPLEGYLFPDTYEFFEDADIESIINRMLSSMEKTLEPYKDFITNSEMSAHEYLAMASIAEKEAISSDDRQKVIQVINTRLDLDMPLGMDVTAYYGVMKDMTEDIYADDLSDNNPYNTRAKGFIGLPAGPICSPSSDSIEAAFNPSKTNYVYFVADIKTGKVYFAETTEEFLELKNLYM